MDPDKCTTTGIGGQLTPPLEVRPAKVRTWRLTIGFRLGIDRWHTAAPAIEPAYFSKA